MKDRIACVRLLFKQAHTTLLMIKKLTANELHTNTKYFMRLIIIE